MANQAAVIVAAKEPLEIQNVELYKPKGHELLVKNEIIAFNPVEFKIAKLDILALQFPAILGSTFGGTIEAVGEEVSNYRVEDRVVVSKRFGPVDNRYGAYQRYVVVIDVMVSKMPKEIDLAIPASLMMNLTCVVGLFTGRIGLDKPDLSTSVPVKRERLLIYGGSSSIGSLSVQYLSQAGYSVVTTSSPGNRDFVSKLGAVAVRDHSIEAQTLAQELLADGPFDIVMDTISSPETLAMTAQVLTAQGGGTLYATQPASSSEALAEGVSCRFEPWSECLYEDDNRNLREWLLQEYMPHGLSRGKILPVPIEKVDGGLNGVSDALDRLQRGVSGVRLVADPWD